LSAESGETPLHNQPLRGIRILVVEAPPSTALTSEVLSAEPPRANYLKAAQNVVQGQV